MDEITVLAIDRAERQVGEACRKLSSIKKIKINAIMLVNEAFSRTPAYKGDETNGLFKEIRCDFDDESQLQTFLNDFKNHRIILHCRMEEAIKDYQKVIEYLPGAHAQSIESLSLSTKKFEMRKAISSKYPHLCPKFIQISSASELTQESLKEFTFPVILKPNGLHSSFFVTKCETIDESMATAKKIFGEIDKVYAREYGTGSPSIVVEEFMEGEMYSIDAYVTYDRQYFFLPVVRVITAAELGLDGYYSYRHILPTELSESDIEEANTCTKEGMQALGLRCSTAHVELYKTKDGWKIIEIGPRIGGYRQELYMEAFGIDHYYNDLLIHNGENPIVAHKWEKHAAGLNIYADHEGTIVEINGVEEAKKLESVVELKCHVSVGDEAVFASNGGQFLVDGILSNTVKAKLEHDVTKVRELIQFTIEN